MNQNASPQDAPPPLTDYKDRHVGLLVFGILEILLGAMCLLMVGLMILGQAMLFESHTAPWTDDSIRQP